MNKLACKLFVYILCVHMYAYYKYIPSNALKLSSQLPVDHLTQQLAAELVEVENL